MRPRLSPSKLNGEMRLAESAAHRARDHAIDESGLPAGFTPPCWRNNIAVVDNDARARRTLARLNLLWDAGSSTWHAGSQGESGRLRALRARYDGQENFFLPIFENPEEKLPASSIILFHVPGFDAWPRFPRPPLFPLSSASSPKFVSAIALSAPPVRCSSRIAATVASMFRSRHPLVLTTFTTPVDTGAWYIVEESIDFVGAVCVGALKAESCGHRSSPM